MTSFSARFYMVFMVLENTIRLKKRTKFIRIGKIA